MLSKMDSDFAMQKILKTCQFFLSKHLFVNFNKTQYDYKINFNKYVNKDCVAATLPVTSAFKLQGLRFDSLAQLQFE